MPLNLQALPAWLDEETSALVREKAELLAERHPDVVAVILYGSVSRHEERALNEPDPSDNVKRDGRILYRRGELPAPFAGSSSL